MGILNELNNIKMLIGIIAIILIILVAIQISILSKQPQIIIKQEIQTLNETLSKIQQNCGTTFITKQYDNENWFIFRNICKSDGYCKYEYTPIEDCL